MPATKRILTINVNRRPADGRGFACRLILALASQEAAEQLPSRYESGSLVGDLASLFSRIDSNQLDVKSVTPLLNVVIRRAKDEDIWEAVFDLIAQTKPTGRPITPPRSAPISGQVRSGRGDEPTSTGQEGEDAGDGAP